MSPFDENCPMSIYLYNCSSFASCRCSGNSRGTHPQKSKNGANTINEKLLVDVSCTGLIVFKKYPSGFHEFMK